MPETHVPVTLETPLGTLTFNDVSTSPLLLLSKFDIKRQIRSSSTPAPQRHGLIVPRRFPLGGAEVVIEGLILTGDRVRRAELMDEIEGYVLSMLDVEGTLKWSPTGGVARQMMVRAFDTNPIGGGLYKSFQLMLLSDDPREYSQAETSTDSSAISAIASGNEWTFGDATPTLAWTFGDATPTEAWEFGTDAGGGTVTVTNAGLFGSPPVIKLFGTITNPVIKNITTGKEIAFTGLTIAAGNYLEIDTARATVRYNGVPTQPMDGYLGSTTEMWELAPGDNNVRLTGTNPDASAKATVIFRSAWV